MKKQSIPLSGCVLGYDPGGYRHHGVSVLNVYDGQIQDLTVDTLPTVTDVLAWFGQHAAPSPILGLGIDTLLAWSSAQAGDRPADRALRHHYPQVARSVLHPNGLRGAMCINGPFVAQHIRQQNPAICLYEAHPVALYWDLSNHQPLRHSPHQEILINLGHWLHLDAAALAWIKTAHEVDAVLGSFAALEALRGHWHDLYLLPRLAGEVLHYPAGAATFPWPVELHQPPDPG